MHQKIPHRVLLQSQHRARSERCDCPPGPQYILYYNSLLDYITICIATLLGCVRSSCWADRNFQPRPTCPVTTPSHGDPPPNYPWCRRHGVNIAAIISSSRLASVSPVPDALTSQRTTQLQTQSQPLYNQFCADRLHADTNQYTALGGASC